MIIKIKSTNIYTGKFSIKERTFNDEQGCIDYLDKIEKKGNVLCRQYEPSTGKRIIGGKLENKRI